MTRSFLFVPADDERKMQKARSTNADTLILDLEDSVAASAKGAARDLAREFLQTNNDHWVRINPLATDDASADLDAVMSSAPHGIILPKARSADDAKTLDRRLTTLEKEHKIPVGVTRILPLCTEHPEALFTLNGYVGATDRLAGLSWGAEDLSAAIGASASRDDDGSWLPTYELARSLCLLAAAAAEVVAIDTVFTNFRDEDGLARYANKARRDGFSGMLAIHPAQIDVINSAFTPTTQELAHAERIVSLFESNPDAGTIGMDGKMLDRPHLVQARRILSQGKN